MAYFEVSIDDLVTMQRFQTDDRFSDYLPRSFLIEFLVLPQMITKVPAREILKAKIAVFFLHGFYHTRVRDVELLHPERPNGSARHASGL
mgnify:CR=1 FL=1